MGTGLADAYDSWPSALPGRVVVDGFAGSGFTRAASRCPGVAFELRLERALATDPDLVVVQGGLNDFDVPVGEVAAAARSLVARLDGQPAVLVGPPSAPRRAAGAARVDRVLREAAAEGGVTYVSTLAWDLEYLQDRLHLTRSSHRGFGAAVALTVRRLQRR
jgi:acyl-CoA thioesterase-1